jgi:MFS family permease
LSAFVLLRDPWFSLVSDNLLNKRSSLVRIVGRDSATSLLASSYGGSANDLSSLHGGGDPSDDGDEDAHDADHGDCESDTQTSAELPAVPSPLVSSASVDASSGSGTKLSRFLQAGGGASPASIRTTYRLPAVARGVVGGAAGMPVSPHGSSEALLSTPGRRARSNSVPAMTNFSANDDDDDEYLDEDTVEAIWERFAPVGSRGTLRRVRPVVVRNEKEQLLLDNQLTVHKRHLFLRLTCLVLMCVICFGDYINYDVPGALIADLKQSLKLDARDDAKIGVLYSVYTFPNTVVVLLGGFLIDRIGLRITALLFVSLVVAGSALFAVAETLGLYWLAVVARAVYGLGGESTYVCVDAIMCEYFDQSQLSIAMTVQAAFLNFGDLVTFSSVPRIAELYGTSVALWFVCSTCACAFVAAVVWVVIDKLYEPEVDDEHVAAAAAAAASAGDSQRSFDGAAAALESAELPVVYRASDSGVARKSSGAGSHSALSHASVVLRTKPLPPVEHSVRLTVEIGRMSLWTSLKRLWTRLKRRASVFDFRFWSLAMTAASLSAAVNTFSGFAPDLLLVRFPNLSQTDAATIVSSISIANIVATPVLGLIFSRMRQVSIGVCVTFGMAIMSCAHFYLGAIPDNWPSWPAMAVVGAVYALLSAAIWPTLPLVVRESRIGTAYGLLYALSNMIVSGLYALIGSLISTHPGIVAVLWGSISAFGCVMSILWNRSMTRKSGGLWATLTSEHALELEPPA